MVALLLWWRSPSPVYQVLPPTRAAPSVRRKLSSPLHAATKSGLSSATIACNVRRPRHGPNGRTVRVISFEPGASVTPDTTAASPSRQQKPATVSSNRTSRCSHCCRGQRGNAMLQHPRSFRWEGPSPRSRPSLVAEFAKDAVNLFQGARQRCKRAVDGLVSGALGGAEHVDLQGSFRIVAAIAFGAAVMLALPGFSPEVEARTPPPAVKGRPSRHSPDRPGLLRARMALLRGQLPA